MRKGIITRLIFLWSYYMLIIICVYRIHDQKAYWGSIFYKSFPLLYFIVKIKLQRINKECMMCVHCVCFVPSCIICLHRVCFVFSCIHVSTSCLLRVFMHQYLYSIYAYIFLHHKDINITCRQSYKLSLLEDKQILRGEDCDVPSYRF